MRQKIILLILAFLLPITAFAWSNDIWDGSREGGYDFEVDGIYYNFDSGFVKVCTKHWSEYYDCIYNDEISYFGSIDIPETVTFEGNIYTVQGIDDVAFSGCTDLTAISIPKSVTTIGKRAFDRCESLVSICVDLENPIFDSRGNCNAINITASNTLIVGCNNTIIPNSITTIGGDAFCGRTGLTSIDIPNSVTTIASGNCGHLIYSPAITGAFRGCTSLSEIEIPNSVTTVGGGAFSGCTGLLRVVIGESVSHITNTEIDEYDEISTEGSFLGCTSITDLSWNANNCSTNGSMPANNIERITIGENVKTIPSDFANGSKITSLVIPNSINNIGRNAYSNCSTLLHISVENGNEVFDSRDSCNAIIETASNLLISGCMNTTIPNSITSIGMSAFAGCNGLTSINIPESVTSIGENAFNNCLNIVSISIPQSVTYIGNGAFSYCTSLSNIDLPNTINHINEATFSFCSSLTNVIIPRSVTSIGNKAFSNCSNLVNVTSKAITPPVISSNTFDCYERATLFVSRKAYEAYFQADNWCRFNNIQFESDLVANYLYYEFTSDSTVCVSCVDDNYFNYSSDVVIPESVNYNGKDYIVNAIDEKAFYNCSSLTSVTIPNTITTIGNYSFYGCSGLSSLTIGKSVTSIGNNAFSRCDNLKELTWNAKNCSSNSNMSKSNIEHVTIGSEVEVLPNYFVSESKIAEVTIPNSVTWIGVCAFSNCNGLTSIDIPNSVTVIDNLAFYNCTGLSNLTIGNSVYYIGSDAFRFCTGLTDITLSHVQTIGEYAFYGCAGLKRIEFSNSLFYIYDRAFSGCSGLNSITIPNNVREIGQYAFYNCSHLTSITFGKTVPTIGYSAFLNCNALSKVTISDVSSWCKITFSDYYSNPLYYSHHLYMNGQEIKQLVIPEGVTALNNFAFVNGTSFLELTLPTTLESIGNYAFVGCKRLTNVSMGLSVTTIGSGAFKDCTAISSVTCMASTPPTMAGVDCFDSDCYDWATLYVPGDKVDEYKSTIYWNKFANTFGTGIEVDGLFYLFDLDKGEATVTYKDETYYSYRGEVIIPETVNYGGLEYTVTGIGKAAFAYCDELMSVTIPHTVTSIGDYAFMYCEGLTSITIPDSVKSIGDNSFDGCGALCAVEIPNSVISIGNMAFQGCTSLTDITIGSGVTNIGAKAFNYCNSLHSVTCMGSVPPLMDNSDCFTSYGYTATLKVPQTSIEDYQSSNYWYKFAVIEGFNLSEPGDVNGDGGINISDVTSLIDLLLSGGETSAGADVNGDGQVNISDVTALIDRLLSGN